MDAMLGCGDLVFSSHTTFQVLQFVVAVCDGDVVCCCVQIILVLSVFKYLSNMGWSSKILRWVLILEVIVFSLTDIAAHKHYTLDVFTALYVAPAILVVSASDMLL